MPGATSSKSSSPSSCNTWTASVTEVGTVSEEDETAGESTEEEGVGAEEDEASNGRVDELDDATEVALATCDKIELGCLSWTSAAARSSSGPLCAANAEAA
ncbi:hypothetical protein BOTBODRAFT_492947 [Botryobasidium botryosum FD-172 SS1]|uniref:Uncharacterized protein n=1 Tax=Botryobasidium botryosum (strain FD-172 SS1) TaxID=930990 RepID=A0A067M3Z0_BOTB1|nr:hypothetical protein BOTBODRAFT_492947 [Botryobasidium botryosum FD-172 SS1]